MDSNISNILSIVASITALISVLLTLSTSFRDLLKQKRTLEEIDEKKFYEAITSSDIKQLGNYLDNVLGQVTVAEYSTNKKIQRKVNAYVQSVIFFIGTEDEVSKIKIEKPETETFSGFDIPRELQSIARELRLGQPWNALAQLRRYIEICLREVLVQSQVEIKEHIPSSQILSMLGSMNIIPLTAARDLKFAISVCNKAIHGVDTTQSEAEEAFLYAINGLEEIWKLGK